MQTNNSFFVFPQLVQHHVVGYLLEPPAAMDGLLAGGKFNKSLVQFAVFIFEYDSSNLLNDVDMLMSLLLSGLCNYAHDIEHYANVYEGHKIHHLEHLQAHLHTHHRSNTRNSDK
jgi:hypothetical protein